MSHKDSGEGKRSGSAGDDAAPRQPGQRGSRAGQAETEAGIWRRETGYRPSANQTRDEPMPASHQAPRGQEAVERNEQHASGDGRARPSRRARKRDGR